VQITARKAQKVYMRPASATVVASRMAKLRMRAMLR
jgi:hypothetical protein